MLKKIFKITAFMLAFGMFCTACSGSGAKEETEQDAATASPEVSKEENPKVLLTLEDGRTIKMELYPEIAPLSCDLFLKGVETGYYDGKVFHRAVPGFLIQGGSLSGTGVGGMDETIKGEFASNGFDNPLSHKRGVLSLARTNAPNSASGQFFIMHDDGEFLDGNYAAFGMVLEGMDVVDDIAEMPTSGEMLIEKPVIESIVLIEE